MRRDRGHRGDHSEPLGVTIRWGGLGGLVECYLEVAPALALGGGTCMFDARTRDATRTRTRVDPSQ